VSKNAWGNYRKKYQKESIAKGRQRNSINGRNITVSYANRSSMEINSGVSMWPRGSIKVEFARNGSKIIQVRDLKRNRRNRKQIIQKKKACLLD
jgi:hypothetical protein